MRDRVRTVQRVPAKTHIWLIFFASIAALMTTDIQLIAAEAASAGNAKRGALQLTECIRKRDAREPNAYRLLAACEARHYQMPPEVAYAVLEIESAFNPSSVGKDGEIGLMQVLPSTARMMGFSGTTSELSEPAANIKFGVRYLAEAYHLAGKDLCTTLMKYRAGHDETRFSARSVAYCMRARSILDRDGYAVSGSVPTATFGFSSAAANGVTIRTGGSRRCVRRVFVPGPRYRSCAMFR